jgi:predicted transcriptional regulator
MRFEVEVISEELLPAIRSIMASRLGSDFGLTQQEIADKLGVTQPAVSQYMDGSRADQEKMELLENDMQIDILLDEATEKAASDQDFSPELAQVVSTVRDKGLMREEFSDSKNLIR